jgi:hypothetical protein
MTQRLAVASCLAVLFAAAPAWAQRQSGSLVGRVTDGQGSPLARVTVTLSGPMGASTTQTDSDGQYRFAAVDPGTYDVKADLAGLSSQRRQGVVVQIAKQAVSNFALAVAGVEVEVAVAEAPVDAMGSSFDTALDQDLLFHMPFRRTAIDVIDNAPGIRDRSGFGGDADTANALLLDGVEFRDPSSGSPFVFLNYNWLDQVQVMGPGAPAEYGLYTGAIINSITRSGGNRHSGLFDVLYSHNRSQRPEEAAVDPDRTRSYTDFSAQLGGPLVKDKLFFFVGAQRRRFVIDPGGPRTESTNTAPRLVGKLSYRPGPKDDFTALVESDRADLRGDTPADSDALTTDVASPDLVTEVQWRHSFGDRTVGEAKYTGWSGYFDRVPRVPEPGFFDTTTGTLTNSFGIIRQNDRERHQANLTLSHYAEGYGRHNFRFGVEVERSSARYRQSYVDGVFLLGANGVPAFAYTYGYEVTANSDRDSAFVQDSWQIGSRLTVNPGLRADWIRGGSPGQDSLEDVVNLQPRLGLAWDLSGKGSQVVKAHVGRYSEAALTEIWRRAAPAYEERVFYQVLDQDPLFRRPFLHLTRPYAVDPDLRHPEVDEAAVGFEGLLSSSIHLLVTGLWREFKDPVGTVMPDERWTATMVVNPLTGAPATIYAPRDPTPNVESHLITNPEGFRYLDPQGRVIGVASTGRRYQALMVVLSRAFAGGWQARASYVLSRARGDLDSQITLAVPGRFGKYDGPTSALANTFGELNTSRRHELKLMGSYQVPRADVMVSAFFQLLSGQRYAALELRSFAPGRPAYTWLLEPRGTRELPAAKSLDLRVEKFFRLGGGGDRLGAYVDVTNVLGSRTVTDANACVPSSDELNQCPAPQLPLGAPTFVQAPRQAAFGLRYTF